MLCPHCSARLQPVFISDKLQQAVIVDQCVNCGGIWFDEWELFPIDSQVIKKIDSISNGTLAQDKIAHTGKNLCPKCRESLIAFKDPLIPTFIEMDQCKACRGLWLNQGETSEYKEWQDKKRLAAETKEKIRIAAQVLAAQRLQESALYKIGSVLSTPLYQGSHGIGTIPEEGALNESTNRQAEKIANIAILVLETLLRIIFRF